MHVYIRFCIQECALAAGKNVFVHTFHMLWKYLIMLVHSFTFITGTNNSCGQFPRNAQGPLVWLHLTSYHKDISKLMALTVMPQALSQKLCICTLFFPVSTELSCSPVKKGNVLGYISVISTIQQSLYIARASPQSIAVC